VLHAPRVAGPMRRHVMTPFAMDDARIETTISRGVFPIVYEAAAQWIERHDLASLIARYRRRSVQTISHLGHSFTIWCSFHEALPHLTTRDQQMLAAERFVEFVGAQLHYNGPRRGPDETALDGPAVDDATVLDAVLADPGFLGHTLITFAHLVRHRALLDDAEYRFATSRVLAMAKRTAIQEPGTSDDVASAIKKLAMEGPREVHSLTLADAAHDLAAIATPKQRAQLVEVLLTAKG
jgi:hypothetical protein